MSYRGLRKLSVLAQAQLSRLSAPIKQVHKDRKGQRVQLAPQDPLGAKGLLVLLVAQVLLVLLVLQVLLEMLVQQVQRDRKVM